MSLSEKIVKSFKRKAVIRLKTRHPEGDRYDGLVIHIAQNFVVLAEEVDFCFDGIIVLPKRIISGYRDGKFERCTNRIMQHNGNIKKLKSPKWIEKCGSLAEILSALKAKDIWPNIETIYGYGRNLDTDFYIGQIVDVEDRCFRIRHYDAAGEWEGEVEIDYNDLFRIEFNDSYSVRFNEYMKAKLKRK